MFDCCTISVLLFHHDCFAVPLFYYQMFYCCTIMFHCSIIYILLRHHLCCTVPYSLFHCCIIRCSTVLPLDVLLFHLLRSTVLPSVGPLFHHQMFYCSTISFSLVHHDCFTVPPPDVPLFHHLCSTVPSIFRIFLRKGTESSFLMKIYFFASCALHLIL